MIAYHLLQLQTLDQAKVWISIKVSARFQAVGHQGGHPRRISTLSLFWRLNNSQYIYDGLLHLLDAFSEPPGENMVTDEVNFIVSDPII
jgi:hypothetical protein